MTVMTLALRRVWDRVALYIPVLLMSVLAFGTYWLVRNTPSVVESSQTRAPVHEPDYYMRRFQVKSFDADGKLKSEVFGTEARHYPDTDTLEIDAARIRLIGPTALVTVATAERARSNGDGSEIQLLGNAVVVREPATDAQGNAMPRLEFRSDFLHVFVNTERVRTHKPVVLTRGADRFSAEAMDYDNVDRMLELHNRVRGFIAARPAP